ncbi:HAD family hydrolase [Planotetraspora kaengkrachanensis]|uniref:Haloacid dehalogenase n=1 Tax=Planotetraspora kaengkrachanensis TaxID=575193 RepID=A0A8J3VAX9_9ACTN|nr:HAD family hydrolase [Planotetraspora kaengkrachanensis]GIG83563.1 haloacid dehalogenase [Planotetraspora kaengkrachanensis]
MIRAILFDLDETLFDHRRAVAYAAASWTESVSPGHPLVMETPALWLDLENRHLPAWHAGECSFAEQRRRRLRDFCGRMGLRLPPDLDAAYADFLVHYEAAWAAFPDAAEVIDALAGGGLTLGVLTNGVPVQQEAKLRRIGLMDRLDPVLTPDSLGGNFKPSAECYLRAAAKLGLRPQEVVLVGDNLQLDAVGPAKVGMHGVWLDRYGSSPASAVDPETSSRISAIRSLNELPGVLRVLDPGFAAAAPPRRTARAGQARRVSAAAATRRRA